MKIINVKFKNLNSLQGVHEISFDSPPFTDSGLFAITGPTGSGKTTILDAITVALYGRVHRHQRNVEEIMSRHTYECYSEVVFEIKSRQYRARWSLNRANKKADGKLQAEKMELATLPEGTLTGQTLTAVKAEIIELCGLDYEQFLRSVILSQGDFTAFLKARDNERCELLEKITGSFIYSKVSVKVFKRQAEELSLMTRLKDKMNEEKLLPADEKNTLQTQLTGKTELEVLFKAEQAALVRKIQWLDTVASLEVKKSAAADSLTGAKQLLEQNQHNFTRLSEHQQAVKFLPDLTRIEAKSEEIKKLENLVASTMNELEPAKDELSHAGIASEQAEAAVKIANEAYVLMEPLIQLTEQLDADIRHTAVKISQAGETLANARAENAAVTAGQSAALAAATAARAQAGHLESWLQEHENARNLERDLPSISRNGQELAAMDLARKKIAGQLADESSQLSALELQITNLTALVTESEKASNVNRNLLSTLNSRLEIESAGQTVREMESAITDLNLLIQNCEKAYRLAAEFIRNSADQAVAGDKLREMNTLHAALRLSRAALAEEKDLTLIKLAAAKEVLQAEQRFQRYDEVRATLVPGSPCPLCGSVSHPFAGESHEEIYPLAENRVREFEIMLLDVTRVLEDAGLKENSAQLSSQERVAEISRLAADSDRLTEEFNEVNNSFPKRLLISRPAVIQAVIQNKRILLADLLQRLNSLKLLTGELNTAVLSQSQLQGIIARDEEKLNGLYEKCSLLKRQAELLGQALAEAEIRLRHLIQETRILIQYYGLEFSIETLPAQRVELTEYSALYKSTLEQHHEIHLRLAALDAEQEHLCSTLAVQETGIRLAEKIVIQEQNQEVMLLERRRELLADKSTADERTRYLSAIRQKTELKDDCRSLLQEKTGRLAQLGKSIKEYAETHLLLKGELSQVTENLRTELQKRKLPDIEELGSLVLQEDEARQLVSLEKETLNAISHAENTYAALTAELVAVCQEQLTTALGPVLIDALSEQEDKLAELNQEIGRIRQILHEDNRAREKFEQLALETEIQRMEFSRWNRLSSLIGSADGKKFSKFAQGLTLARLTDLANVHLTRLSDRYQILKTVNEDLGLSIIDLHQADAVRPMSTLSGGESFLVSLALAFGLSDLASRKVKIDTLFIDEGFGTLDADTLDTAISALENLQATGKTIGIISHVEALKDRISVQIQLSRQTGGTSIIKLKDYSSEALEI